MVCSFYSQFLKETVNMQKILLSIILCLSFVSSAYSGTLADNFNDGDLASWRMYENFRFEKIVIPDPGNWIVEDGTAVGGDDDSGKVYGLYIGDMSWKNYTAEVSVKLLKRVEKCSIGAGVWLATRLQLDEGKFGLNAYIIGIWNDSRFGAVKGGAEYANGDGLNLQIFMHPLCEANVWYKLSMTANGNYITGFVDDVKVFDLLDDSFTSGAVALAVNGLEAAFDDFMVTGLEIPDVQLSQPVKPSGKLATTWANIKISTKE